MIAPEGAMTTDERFWAKVEKTEGCWLWTGAKRHKGYGAFVYARDGEVVQGRAHRYSYEVHVGPIPPGVFVLHRCDTPACVRPDHLFLGTNQDNVTDMMKKGRHVSGGTYKQGNYERGTAHHNARLTPEIVREIRASRDDGASFGQLAKRYGLAIGHVHRIVHRIAWGDVD
jgi:hypothetical protein